MKRRLSLVLLIDDDDADNLFHQIMLERAGCTEAVAVATGGQAALDLLTGLAADQKPLPELIFLDINMPGMTGWEFLEKYHQLDPAIRRGIVITFLSTSTAPRDIDRAQRSHASGFLTKPLSVALIEQVLEEHFPDLC